MVANQMATDMDMGRTLEECLDDVVARHLINQATSTGQSITEVATQMVESFKEEDPQDDELVMSGKYRGKTRFAMSQDLEYVKWLLENEDHTKNMLRPIRYLKTKFKLVRGSGAVPNNVVCLSTKTQATTKTN